MTEPRPRILVLGYGNPGRLDDGLGVALAAAVETLDLPALTVESAYQLNVEDAESLARHDVAVFADAAVEGPEPFAFGPVQARPGAGFTTHHLDPGTLLDLARTLFGARTAAYLLAIRGYVFHDFGQELSAAALANLEAAVRFLRSWLTAPHQARHVPAPPAPPENAGDTPPPFGDGT